MADNDTGRNDEAAPQRAAVPALTISGQYIKDLSFEAPNAPGVFTLLQQQAPDVSIGVDVNARPIQERNFEVSLHIKAECRTGETTAFIIELAYAGMFGINVPQDQIEPVLLVECPRQLFPFARAIIADVTRDGGFPPLMLSPIDFVQMYHQNRAAQEQQA